jgi:serine/threonine-protein kinase
LIGSRLLQYEITAKLGEGGMGEVYRATDTRLGREVAIKVLPPAFSEDPERLARFEREARVLAALEHPNIAGIYGLEEVDDRRLLVMQLAPGETLSARLERGPLPLDEALPIALEIATALETAHDRGIVHRDLKPANVMLAAGRSGPTVKVLDFGLAKAWEAGPDAEPSLSVSPTLTAQMTRAGIILGTAGYMSPEQARGQEADRRSDIWSFGVLLHEMITGRRLFEADTVSDTLARVLMAEPDWASLEARLPPAVARLLHRCLERDRERRLQAIGEARIVIEDWLAAPRSQRETGPEAPAEPVGAGRGRWPLMAALLLGGLVLGWLVAVLVPLEPGLAREPLHYSIRPLQGAVNVAEEESGLDISRDGRMIAFVASSPSSEPRIFLKKAGESEPAPIPGTEGAKQPFFSPDGQWLGFVSGSSLYKIGLAGGAPIPLAEARDVRGAVWHPDGTIYLAARSNGPIVRVAQTGGEASEVTRLDAARNERTHRWPALLPGGDALLYTSDTFESTEYYDDARIELVDLQTGEHSVLIENASRAVWSPTGHLIFARDGSLFAVPFDPARRELAGEPQLVLQQVSTIVASGAALFALSDDGSLAYIPGDKTTEIFDLVWLSGEDIERVAPELGGYFQAALSPGGDRVVLASNDRGAPDLWMYDMERGSIGRFTFEDSFSPVWAADGSAVFFSLQRDGASAVARMPADGLGEIELIFAPGTAVEPADVSPDGRWLAVTGAAGAETWNPSTGVNQLWIVDLEGEREPYRWIEETIDGQARFSPDGRWLTYVSSETGTPQIFVRPFPSAEGKWQVSDAMSREPHWSPDGRRLYYRSTAGLRVVDVDPSSGLRIGKPRTFVPGSLGTPLNHTYSVGADGRLLVLRPSEAEQRDWSIHVLLHWKDELEKLLVPRA